MDTYCVMHVCCLFQPGAPDVDVKPGIHAQDKINKGPAQQYDGDQTQDQEHSEGVPPNGILQNGLEDDKTFR